MKKTMENTVNAEPEASKSQPHEDYLRESILGSYIRNFNKRLRTLSRDTEDWQYRMEQKLIALEKQYPEDINALKAEIGQVPHDINARIDERIDERLNGMLGSGEEDLQKMSTLINESAREFQRQIEELRQEIQQLKDQTHRNHQTLRADLTSENETLDIAKVDRLVLADALIALGTTLKEEKPFPEFDDAVDVNLDDILNNQE